MQLPSALARYAVTASRRVWPSSGRQKGKMVVFPPHAALRVPVVKSSAISIPGPDG